MGKKTLKQKKRADEKRSHHHVPSVSNTINSSPFPTTYTFTTQHTTGVAQPLSTSSHQLHVTYVTQDLRKTLILSFCIVVFEIALYFLLHDHLLALPMIRY